jgi:membrane fusion protein (multidrug efflux system)
MSRNKKLLFAIFLGAAVAGLFFLNSKMKSDKSSNKIQQLNNPPIPVESIQIEKSSIARKKTFSGILKSSDSISLVSEGHGRIEKINCTQGQFVKKGQLLFQLDSVQAIAAVQEARATLNACKMDFDRHKSLWLKKAVAKSKVEESASKFILAQAKLATAQSQEKATKIIAPFDGQIGLFSLSVGTHVSPNQELARLISFRPLVVEFQVPESEIKYIYPNQKLEVLSELLDILPVSATITAIDPYSDPVTHTVRVKATLSEESRKLRDGAFAHVTIVLGEAHDAIVVPQEAILRESDSDFVYLLIDGHARKTPVSLGFHDGSRFQVEDGITLGQTVIIDPVEYLYDNAPVSKSSEDSGAIQ